MTMMWCVLDCELVPPGSVALELDVSSINMSPNIDKSSKQLQLDMVTSLEMVRASSWMNDRTSNIFSGQSLCLIY